MPRRSRGAGSDGGGHVRDDRRVRRGGRERDANAGFHRLDPGGDFQGCRADCLEGSGAPSGFSGRCIAQIEH